MKVFLDTNIILDYVLVREPNIKVVDKIIDLIFNSTIQGYTSTNCLTDIFYISSKDLGKEAAKEIIFKIIGLLYVISVDLDDCVNALNLPIPDFEDALIVSCADKANVDNIITYDNDFCKFSTKSCKIVKPEEFLKII